MRDELTPDQIRLLAAEEIIRELVEGYSQALEELTEHGQRHRLHGLSAISWAQKWIDKK